MKTPNAKQFLSLILNAIIAIAVFIIACKGIVRGAGDAQLGTYIISWGYFKPFTMDSNILAGIAALVMLVCGIRRKTEAPVWATRLYLMAATCLALTMLTAACFLAPMDVLSGKSCFNTFSGELFFFHFLIPVLVIVNFICFIPTAPIPKTDRLFAAIPVLIYACVYITMVVFTKQWNDFYNFTFGGKYALIPLVLIVIFALVRLIASVMIRLHNRCMKG